jgi:acyl-coenzyme A synthetase/AMP-(fatty) acid ligase
VVAAAAARAELRLLVTIGAERPLGSRDFDELVSSARSAVQISSRPDSDLVIVGYTSGTTPQRVHFVASSPRNASLKVRKDQLRAELGRREPDGTGVGESS